MTRLRVGLLFGGCSGEHEVSIASGRAIAKALASGENRQKYQMLPFYIQKEGYWHSDTLAQQVLDTGAQPSSEGNRWSFPPLATEIDVWFPILHGPNGEDGTVQGLLSLLQVPFVGSGVLASAVGMDKLTMKTVFAQAGLPQVKYMALNRSQVWSPCLDPICDQIATTLGYPCFVKPANLGSSVGISKVRSRNQLETALNEAASYDRRLIVEAGVTAREVECAVLGNEKSRASVVGEITYQSDFYDYETKYAAGQAELLIPAPLPTAVTQQIQTMALQAFAAIHGAGLARVDFFYIQATGEVLINEINTLPGFTATSMYPRLWEATGISFPSLVDQLIQLALEQYPLRKAVSQPGD